MAGTRDAPPGRMLKQVAAAVVVLSVLGLGCSGGAPASTDFRGGGTYELDKDLPSLPQFNCSEGDTFKQIVTRDFKVCDEETEYQQVAHAVPREEHFACACGKWYLVWSQFLWNPRSVSPTYTGEQCRCGDEGYGTGGPGSASVPCGSYVEPYVTHLPETCEEASSASAGDTDTDTDGVGVSTSSG